MLFAVSASPQATVNQIYTRSAIVGDAGFAAGNIIVDAPLVMTRDETGKVHLTLGLGPAVGLIVAGSGGIGGTPTQAFIDTAHVTYRTAPPAGPGVCDIGTGGWAAGNGYFYVCVVNQAGDGFIWARTALDAGWQ